MALNVGTDPDVPVSHRTQACPAGCPYSVLHLETTKMQI
jgi:hypothetical protein